MHEIVLTRNVLNALIQKTYALKNDPNAITGVDLCKFAEVAHLAFLKLDEINTKLLTYRNSPLLIALDIEEGAVGAAKSAARDLQHQLDALTLPWDEKDALRKLRPRLVLIRKQRFSVEEGAHRERTGTCARRILAHARSGKVFPARSAPAEIRRGRLPRHDWAHFSHASG